MCCRASSASTEARRTSGSLVTTMEALNIEEILLEGDTYAEQAGSEDEQKQCGINSLAMVCIEIVDVACSTLLSDDCIFQEIKDIIQRIDRKSLVPAIEFMNKCLVKKGKFKNAAKEKAYANFHKAYDINHQIVENVIPRPATFWVCLKVFELLVNKNYNESEKIVQPPTSELCTDETDIVEYIGGYVVHSIKKHAHRLKNVEDKSQMLLCVAAMTANLDEPSNTTHTISASSSQSSEVSQPLTAVLDRGGLTKLKANIIPVFLSLESVFRQCFNGQMHTLSSDLYFSKCCQSDSVNTFLYEQLYKIDATEKNKENILCRIINTYFKIRAHHKCKKFMEQHRLATKTSGKQKGLRKGLSK